MGNAGKVGMVLRDYQGQCVLTWEAGTSKAAFKSPETCSIPISAVPTAGVLGPKAVDFLPRDDVLCFYLWTAVLCCMQMRDLRNV